METRSIIQAVSEVQPAIINYIFTVPPSKASAASAQKRILVRAVFSPYSRAINMMKQIHNL